MPGVVVRPGFEILDPIEGLFAENGLDPLLVRPPLLFLDDTVLPRGAEDEMHVIVQVSAFEDFPLVLVEPDPAATGAAVNVEDDAVPDLAAAQEAPALRA